jgi:hypothetical protein
MILFFETNAPPEGAIALIGAGVSLESCFQDTGKYSWRLALTLPELGGNNRCRNLFSRSLLLPAGKYYKRDLILRKEFRQLRYSVLHFQPGFFFRKLESRIENIPVVRTK